MADMVEVPFGPVIEPSVSHDLPSSVFVIVVVLDLEISVPLSSVLVLSLSAVTVPSSFLVEAPDGTPLLFVGLVPFTLLGGEVYIWMIPFRALGLSHLREMKVLFDAYAKRYTKITAQILLAETKNRRWLRFFGFKEVLQASGLVVYERSG